MNTFTATLILTLGVLILFFVGLGIRILLLKNGEFRGSCSSNNPYNQREGKCGVCGKEAGEMCGKDEMEANNNSGELPSVAA